MDRLKRGLRAVGYVGTITVLVVGAGILNAQVSMFPPAAGVTLTSAGAGFFVNGIGLGGTAASPYANLYGEAANTLALRNGTNAQAFYAYGTYTDASNHEKGGFVWSTDLQILTAAAGTGTTRNLRLLPSSGNVYAYSLFPQDGTRSLGGQSGSTTMWDSLALERGVFGGTIKNLTESSATAAWDCTLAAGTNVGGKFEYCVFATDGTDHQERCADVRIAAVNKAGTTTCNLKTVLNNSTVDQTTDANADVITSGTLTYAVTCADTTDSFSVSFNAVSSLAQTTLRSESRWNLTHGASLASCTPQ